MDPALKSLINALRPHEMALRDRVRPLLTPAVVRMIASMDHGEGVEENEQAIGDLLAVKRLPEELLWPPREVLELASHHRPDSREEHAARLFACLVIVHSDDAVQPAATLAALVESAVALGPDATEEAVRYLAWCRLHEPGAWRDHDMMDGPFLTLGLLLAYLLSPLRHDPRIVAGLARAVVAEIDAVLAKEQPWWPDQPPAGLLKKTSGGDAYRIWQALVARCAKVEAIEPLRGWFTPG